MVNVRRISFFIVVVAIVLGGEVAVLDVGGDRVAVVGRDGTLRASVPIHGPHIDEAGLATGVTFERGQVWVETGHAWNVLVADDQGAPADPRDRRDGRASR